MGHWAVSAFCGQIVNRRVFTARDDVRQLAAPAEGDLNLGNRIVPEVLVNLPEVGSSVIADPIIEADAYVDQVSCFARWVVSVHLVFGACDIGSKLPEESVVQLALDVACRMFTAGTHLGVGDIDCLHFA